MKYFKLTILSFLFLLALINARQVHAATEFISVVDPGNGQGTDYTSLSAWESAIQSDLSTTTATRVFSWSTASGTIPDGASVVGYTSGARATATHMTASTTLTGSAQILLTKIASSTFQSGEKLYILGSSTTTNYVYISDTGTSVIAVAKCRSTGGLPDTTPFWIDGWTATSSNYIKIWTDPNEPFRHQGVWDEDKYLISVSIDEHGIQINENYVTIDGLQILSSVYSGRHAIQTYWSGTTIGETKISNNIIKGRNAANANGIYIGADEPSYGYIWNNIIYDFNGTNSKGISNVCSGASRYYAYNNTVYNSNICLHNDGASSALLLKNNIAQNCSDGFNGSFNSSSDNNISDIAGDAPNATFSTASINVLFADETNYDFHLDSADTAAKNMGTTSVSEIGFTTDADNETRRGNYDIGADENVAKIYRSVGPSATTAIVAGTTNNHSNHLNILKASTTIENTATYAYFEYPLPDNIGVGDAIQYDSDNNGTIDSLAFIHKRLSSQKYKVYKLDATKATTTSVADIDWSIFRAYTSLANAEGGTENSGLDDAIEQFDASWSAGGGKNLTTSNEQWNIACYANGTAADETSAIINGWTTSADSYIRVYTPTAVSEVGISQRHNGVWNPGKYLMQVVGTNWGGVIQIYEDYVRIDGLQLKIGYADAGSMASLQIDYINTTNSNIIVSNNIITKESGYMAGAKGIYQYQGNGKFLNNIIYDFTDDVNACISADAHGVGETYIYNNTNYNCLTGIEADRDGSTLGTIIAKNNIIDNCTTNASGIFAAGTGYNATDDASIGYTVTGGSIGDRTSQTFTFRDEANDDFHLAPNDTGAKNYGADLSYDVYLPIKTDIDADTSCLLEPGNPYNDCGKTRPYNTAHDIGADEAITPIYRSVGPSATTAIASGSLATLTIASSSATSTATFSDYMPDNVGVGDAIQYDSDNNGTINAIAFINYRWSSTVFGVTKYDGTPATSTTAADSDWAIYRAYTSLSNAESGTENANISSVVQQFDSSWSASGGKNIASSSEQWNIACYVNSTTADATSTIISGWTTAPQNYFKIYTPYLASEVGVSQRHSGKWDENKYKLMSANGYRPIYNVINYFRLEGLQISNDTLVDYGVGFISRPDGTRYNTDIRISENIITNSVSPTYRTTGLDLSYGAVYKVYNNIIYNFNNIDSGYGIFIWNGQGLSTVYLYNNTIISSTFGIAGYSDSLFAKNNIVKGSGNTYAYVGTFSPGTDYNFTDGTDNIGQGSNNRISQTFTFLDEANNDFHLAQTDTAAKDAGMDLSNDPCLPVTSDIDGNNRPNSNFQNPGNTFDIGADEAATPIYRSIAPSATTVLTSGTSNAISINATTSTATFASGLADNIGVGDLIQYDADNNGTIDSAAFIHGRTSSTTYTVKDWAGANPVSTIANDNDWGVYRAYTSLANAIGNRFYNEGEGGTENTGASSSINNFDTWSGYKDILTSNEQWNISTYANGTTADVESLEIKDWTTAPLNYLKIYTPTNINEVGTSQRHQGKWDESKYHMTVDDYFGNIYFSSGLINFWIDGLQLRETGIVDESGEMHGGIIDYGGNSDAYQRISNNIIRSDNGSASLNENPVGIALIYDHSKKEVWNNIIYGFQRGIYASVGKENSQTSIYNNTITAALFSGITPTGWPSVSYLYMKNNIVQGSAMNYDFSVIGAGVLTDYANNISEDATSPNTELHNKTVQFADEIGKDFHLAANDTAARGQGVNLYADATTSITTDIEGHARPSSGAFDIGADEAATAIYYSVGQNTDSHETGAGTVTVSSTTQTATFSVAQTATNMGVGDVIDYDTDNKKCYITEKVTTSIWKCQTATGTPPVSATDATVNSIAHAFASLSLGEDGVPTLLGTSDLAADNYQLNLPCYYDTGPDTTAVTVDGWTTGVPNYIRIYTPYDTTTEVNQRQRHWGKWDDGKYQISISSPYSYIITATNPYIRIDGLQIENTCPKNSQPSGVHFDANATWSSDIRFSNNIVRSSGPGTEYSSGGTGVVKRGGLNAVFFNNLIINHTGIVSHWNPIYSHVAYYNNTIISDYVGELGIGENSGEGDYIFVKNNIVQGTHTDGNYGLWNGSVNANNISSDDTSPNSGATDCGGHSCRNQTVQFTDSANGDFHLALTDTTARNAGTSTVIASPAGAWQSRDLAYDIDGNGRSLAGPGMNPGFDIGADEGSVEFAPTVKQSGGDFSSLSSWEAANQVDLISPNTMVFSCATTSGVMPFNSSVIGTSSGATASSTVMSTTSNQILLYNITASSTGYSFQSGEKVYILGGSTTTNYCILSDSGNPAIAVAKIDGTWTSADTNAVTIDGWTTGPQNYVKVYTTATARHNGKWDDNKYRLVIDEESLFLMEENVTVSGLQIYSTNSSSGYNGINADNYLEPNNIFNIIISFNIIKHTNPDSDGASGIFLGGDVGEGSLAKIYNNIIYDWGRSSNGYGIRSHGWYWDAYIYNNTVFNSYYGYSGSGNTPRDVLKNNIMQDCTDGFIQGYGDWNPATSFNISDIPGDAPGAHSATGTVAFIDAANYDFHLSSTDTAARNAGVNLVADATSSFYTDIDGTARGAAWDIGADEVPVEYVSTICQNTSAGGDCANLDYTYLARWEDKVECDLTATSTRVFGGSVTGSLSENDMAVLYRSGVSQNATGTVVATTSDQILIDNIYGTTTPVNAQTGDIWRVDGSNYWTVATSSAHGGNDGLGASPIVVAKIDGAWTASDTTAVELSGWTFDYDNYIKIYTTSAARHNGKWNYNKYRLVNDAYDASLYGYDAGLSDYGKIEIDGLQIENNRVGEGAGQGIRIESVRKNIVSNNIIRFSGNVTTHLTSNYGIDLWDGYQIIFFNNIIYDFYSGIRSTMDISGSKIFIFNNTIYNSGYYGLYLAEYEPDAIFYIVNNLVQNSSSSDYYIFSNEEQTKNNISSDNTSPDSEFQNKTVSFVSTSTGDFRLSATDTIANDTGFDITSSSTLNVIDAIEYDILGTTRPWGSGWDIGAHEYKDPKIYRSVGPGSTAALLCASSTNLLNIINGSASFVGGTLDNIGVGDVIVYNASSSLAFIHSRHNSNKSYTVASTSGYYPDDIANDSGWCIFRAYTSLYNAERGVENTGIPTAIRNFDDWTAGGDATTNDVGRDLVSNKEQWNIALYANGTTADTNEVEINGWITGSTNYLRIFTPYISNDVGTSQRHGGKWDNSKYKLVVSASGYTNAIEILDPFIKIDGLQIKITGSTAYDAFGIYSNPGTHDGVWFSNNIIASEVTAGMAEDGIHSVYLAYIFNNIIYNFTGTGIYSGAYNGSATSYIYNNTVINSNTCFDSSYEQNAIGRNNIAQNCDIGFYSHFFGTEWLSGSGNNISNDNTAPGINSKNNSHVLFVNMPGYDFHISPDDTVAIDAGTSSVSAVVATDIDGTAIRTYDIGADDASQYFESTIKQSGGDFSSLSAWEAANQVDLTATTTMVFNCATTSGIMPFNSSVTGTSSGATASSTVMSTTTNQILLYNITASTSGSFFQSGEKVYITGGSTATNYCILSNAGNPAIAVAKIDGTWTSADTNNVDINGWTTGPQNYVKVYTTPTARHNGKWDENKYRIEVVGTWWPILDLISNFVRIEGLQAYNLAITGQPQGIVMNNRASNKGEYQISNNIVRFTTAYSDGYQIGIVSGLAGAMVNGDTIVKIFNNVIYDAYTGIQVTAMNDPEERAFFYIYNNTILNPKSTGLRVESYNVLNGPGELKIENNLVQGQNTNYNLVGADLYNYTHANNISQDGTSPDSTYQNKNVLFVDSANNDFHLSPSDTAAKNAGTALWNDATSSFYTDIDGTARGAAWDIGADEVPVEYVSTICQNTSAGGDCADLDYQTLAQWEDAVESDLTSTSTRIFTGSQTGTLIAGDTVTLYRSGGWLTATGTVVATTSDQILIGNIYGCATSTSVETCHGTSLPLVVNTNDQWRKDASNYWTISTSTAHGGNDGLGASPIAVAKIDGAWTATDTSQLIVDGWTTDNDNKIKIYTSDIARHNGKWNYNKYRYAHTATGDWDYGLQIQEAYVILDGMQIQYSDGGYSTQVSAIELMHDGSIDNDKEIKNNLIRSLNSSGTKASALAAIGMLYSINAKIFNNIAYDFPGTCINIQNQNDIYYYNNTAYNCNIGFNASDILLKNNLSFNNISEDFTGARWSNASSTNNISSDGTADDAVFLNGLANQSATSTFVDIVNRDFHLASEATAINAGADLSSDPYLNFTTDIDGNARPGPGMNPGFDIGADEVGVNLYRSVGTTATNLNTNNRTVTIAGGAATFSDTMPANVGVGDVLQYNPGSGLTLAFITARTSATVYSVQSATGGTPTAATAVSVSVYRAYNSLNKWESQDENETIDNTLENFDSTTDLVASNTSMFVACYNDGEDANYLAIDGWTTGENNYIKIYTPVSLSEVGTSQRHTGKAGTGYRITNTNNSWAHTIQIKVPFVWIDGMEVTANKPLNVNGISANDLTTYGWIKISNNLIHDVTVGEAGIWNVIVANVAYITEYIWNNIIYNVNNGSTGACINLQPEFVARAYVFNNTLSDCQTYGLYTYSNIVTAVNNIIQDAGDDFYGNQYAPDSNYNLSSDDYAPGSNSKINTFVSFIDETNKDFHLAFNDTGARNQGTSSLQMDSGSEAGMTKDIDGNGRANLGVDIGADEGSTEFVTTIMQSGGDFSSLSQWEAANQVDLTATNTFVYSISSADGQIPVGSSVVGQTSGALASTTVVSTSSNQILMYNVSASTSTGQYFQPGEKVYILGGNPAANFVILDSSLHPDPAIAVAKIDGAWINADTNAVTISGWTTGSENYIKIYTTTAARHQGKWDENKYRIQISTESHTVDIRESYTRLDGLQIQTTTHSESNFKDGIFIYDPIVSGVTKVYISNNIIENGNTINGYGFGIHIDPHIFAPCYIWNNIVYDFSRANDCAIVIDSDNGVNPSYVYNNTIANCKTGIFTSYDRAKLMNNLVKGANNSFSGTFAYGSNYNATDIDDSTIGELNTSSSDRKNLAFSFADENGKDFHLSDSDNGAQDWAADLTNDPVWQEMMRSTSQTNSTTSYDIDGDIRAPLSGWEIGADQLITKIYRSVAPGATSAIASNTAAGITLSVSSTTATFSANLPLNVGVGDVIQYDRDNNGSIDTIAFIHGRLSPSTYKVRNLYGALATSTVAADTDWAIYRAYSFMYQGPTHGNENIGISASLRNFDTFTDGKNIASSSEQWNITCYANGTTTDSRAWVTGWTTDEENYIRVYTPYLANEVGISQRHQGKWDTNFYYSKVVDDTPFNFDNTKNLWVDGLQLYSDSAVVDDRVVFGASISAINANIKISNSIIRGSNPTGIRNGGIYLSNAASSSVLYAWNNIIYDTGTGGDSRTAGISLRGNYWTFYAYNNTVINAKHAYSRSATTETTFYSKNNIAQNCTDVCFYGSFDSSSDFNLSDDGTAPNATFSTSSLSVLFADTDADDFHLAPADTSAKDRGVFLLNDLYLPISIDIDGETRPAGEAFDIGADEVYTYTKINTPSGSSNPPSLSTGLVGYWSFNGPDMDWSSTTAEALDRSGQGNNGDVIGAKSITGKSGQGMVFDGADDYIDLGNNTVLQPAKITVAYWLKRTASWEGVCGNTVVMASGGWGWPGWYIETNDRDLNSGLVMKVDDTNGFYVTTDPDTLYPLNEWVFVTATFDSDTNAYAMYINGSSQSVTAIGTPDTISSDSTEKFIGNKAGLEYFDGMLDEIRVYNRVLTNAEIQSLYNSGARTMQINSPQPGRGANGNLVGYWSFDGQDMDWSSTTAEALDRSGNSYHGNVVGAKTIIGKSGQALSFDSSGQYVDIPDIVEGLSQITMSAWIKSSISDLSASEYVIDQTSGASDTVLLAKTPNETFRCYVTNDDQAGQYVESSVFADTDWHYLACIYNGAEVDLYVDGNLVISDDPLTGIIETNASDNLVISDTYSTTDWNGYIDEVRIYDIALSEAEIQDLYEAGARRVEIRK